MENNPFKGPKLFFAVYFVVLILVLTFIGFMGWLGYEMVDASIKYVLFGLLVGSAMIAGTLWAVKRIWRKWIKVAVASVLCILVLTVIVGMYLAFTLILVTATPLHYTTLTSPAGENVVIMRSLSTNADMLAERLQAKGLDASQGPQSEDDFGYCYTAHAPKMRFFYNKESAGGTVEIGMISAAQLMYEWTDDTTLRLYAGEPEPGDSGEILYRTN